MGPIVWKARKSVSVKMELAVATAAGDGKGIWAPASLLRDHQTGGLEADGVPEGERRADRAGSAPCTRPRIVRGGRARARRSGSATPPLVDLVFSPAEERWTGRPRGPRPPASSPQPCPCGCGLRRRGGDRALPSGPVPHVGWPLLFLRHAATPS
jgi:hypothetical protein